jgi:hypothetical protein
MDGHDMRASSFILENIVERSMERLEDTFMVRPH